jgi:hypothetical protein
MVDRSSRKKNYFNEHNGSSSQQDRDASSLSSIKNLIYLC